MTQNEAINYWRSSAKETVEAAKDNFESRHIDWAFFLWHLAIEKLIKGLIIKRGVVPPPIHKLTELAKQAQIKLSEEQFFQLKEITSYNIEARYDDYKRQFYKKVTHADYAKKWQEICEEIYLWLDKKF